MSTLTIPDDKEVSVLIYYGDKPNFQGRMTLKEALEKRAREKCARFMISFLGAIDLE